MQNLPEDRPGETDCTRPGEATEVPDLTADKNDAGFSARLLGVLRKAWRAIAGPEQTATIKPFPARKPADRARSRSARRPFGPGRTGKVVSFTGMRK